MMNLSELLKANDHAAVLSALDAHFADVKDVSEYSAYILLRTAIAIYIRRGRKRA